MTDSHSEKIKSLQAALAAFDTEEEGGLFDRAEEEKLAPVRKRALGLLDQRARSKEELRQRLSKAEFEPRLIERVLEDFERTGIIDDASFAREWVRQRALRRGKSTRALDRELREKGISEALRSEALEQISREDEEMNALTVAEKKVKEVKALPQNRSEYDKLLRRIVGVLARRGYSSALSLKLGREVLDRRIEAISE